MLLFKVGGQVFKNCFDINLLHINMLHGKRYLAARVIPARERQLLQATEVYFVSKIH
jgi:hypothetical protein